MSNIKVGEAVHKLLKGAGITRVFPNIAENETASPFVIYRVSSFSPARTKDYDYQDNASIEIVAVAETYKGSLDLADQVRKIEKARGEIAGYKIASITLDNITTDYMGTAHVVNMSYTILIDL